MNSQNDTNSRQTEITGETALAIISVALAALWIAFAFYHGTSPDENGNRILLLHPLVPVALIVLLIRIYRWVGIKFVVQLEIIMISLWLIVRMLGVLMPFILGFGFAYIFRFLWLAFPFKKRYQRAIATVLVVLVCGGMLILTGFGVVNQIGQMTAGLQRFSHEKLLPAIVGEDFEAVAVDSNGDTETIYLSTDHGVYFFQIDKKAAAKKTDLNPKKEGITNGEIVGKVVQTLAVSDEFIYAGTKDGVYRRSKSNKSTWTKIDTTPFDILSVQTINVPSWNPKLIYVGTEKGLYRGIYNGTDSSIDWYEDIFGEAGEKSIVSISSIEKFDDTLGTRKERYFYVATIEKRVPLTPQSKQQNGTNTEAGPLTTTNTDITPEGTEEVTQVYWRRANSTQWREIDKNDDAVPNIRSLVATGRKDFELYAATADSIYRRGAAELGTWVQWEGLNSPLRFFSLLVSTPSGLYIGNEEVIHYRSNDTETWNKLIKKKGGVLIYRDAPIVKQFQEYLTEKIPGWTASSGTFVKSLSGLAGSIAFQFGGFLATVFLAFIVFVYANQGFKKYIDSFMGFVPEKHRETTIVYLREIDKNMHQFLKGQFTVIAIVSIISCIVYRVIGVPFALLVGILAGLCNAIPTFGPFIGGGFAYIAMLMGLASGEFSSLLGFFIRCILVLGAILGIQAIDNSLVSPKVMSNAVDVDPLLIMFSVIVGASILGFWGVILAIPTIVVIKSIIAVSESAMNDADTSATEEQT